MEFPDGSLPWQSVYKLMTGAIVPRPIAWVSTVDSDGVANLAPFSFFNAVCSNPPYVLFCASVRVGEHPQKDTLNNVRATGEFVVNIVNEATMNAMNLSAGEYPPDVDEFEVVGMSKAPAQAVKAPRVAESLIHFECMLHQVITLSEEPGGGNIVIGRVVHIHVDDRVFIAPDKINIAELQPIGRLAGNAYSYVHDIFELIRPKK
jgi:flavin reductase (DIM6/NTAB) family NADH-FMN oxidoreductase RutF